MKFRNFQTAFAALSLTTLLLNISPIHAATFTWQGGAANNNWGTTGNWTTIGSPANPAVPATTKTTPLAGVDLIYLNGSSTQTSANVETPWYVDRFVFDSANNFTLSGSAITLRPGAGYSETTTSHDGRYFIINSSSGLKTINNDLTILPALTSNTDGSGINVGSGTLTLNGSLNVNGISGVRVSGGSGSVTINGVISGTHGGWAINGGATTILNSTNTFVGGMTVWSGTLKLGASNALGASSNNLSMSNAGDNNFKSTVVTTTAQTIGNAVTIAAAFNTARATSDFATLGSEAAGITEFTGTVTNGATGIARAVTLTSAAGGRVNFTQGISRSGTATETSDTLTKTGAGIVALSGTSNSWQGNTLVQQGTLLVNGTIVTGTNNVQVSGSATLGGTGTINRNVTIAAAGILSAGDMSGTTSLGGKLTVGSGSGIGLSLANTSVLNFDLATAASTTDDEISVLGNFVLDGVLNVTNAGGFGNGTYKLFDFTGTLTDNGLDLLLGTKPAGFNYALEITNTTNGTINLVVTPEPGRALLLCAGLSALLLRRRRDSVFSC